MQVRKILMEHREEKSKRHNNCRKKTNVTNTHAFVKPKNSQMTFGEKIKSLRDKYSLTQTDLAETLNAYCKKKKNKVSFSRDMIQKWEDDLHMYPAWKEHWY
jgi:DNA-binding transcriptional regulator YiaG